MKQALTLYELNELVRETLQTTMPDEYWATDKTAFTEKLVWDRKKIREIHFKISRFIVTFAYEEFFEGYATRRKMMQ